MSSYCNLMSTFRILNVYIPDSTTANSNPMFNTRTDKVSPELSESTPVAIETLHALVSDDFIIQDLDPRDIYPGIGQCWHGTWPIITTIRSVIGRFLVQVIVENQANNNDNKIVGSLHYMELTSCRKTMCQCLGPWFIKVRISVSQGIRLIYGKIWISRFIKLCRYITAI